jgi:hypothetical protein
MSSITNNDTFVLQKIYLKENMGKFLIIFLYDYDNLDSKTITQQNDICICK